MARIVILKPCCLGDVVFATPLVREIRRALPDARLAFAVGAHSRPAIEGNPHVDAILDTGAVGTGRYGLLDLLKLSRLLREGKFDACFVLERSALLNLVPLLAGIPRRIGIDSGGRGFTLTSAARARPPRPESELYLDLLRATGEQPRSGRLEFHPSDRDQARATAIVRENIPASAPWVVVHGGGGVNPGMALTRKRWPVASYRELIQRITAAGGMVVVVGTEADPELTDALATANPVHEIGPVIGRSLSSHAGSAGVPPATLSPSGRPGRGPRRDKLQSSKDSRSVPAGGVVNLVGRLDLGELAALASMAAAYVGNDSGPSHLAEAAGARVIMLFGPSDPIAYGPRSATSVALTAGLWCSPCFEEGRFPPCANVLCMPGIGVDRVWRELAPLLSQRPADQ